MTQRRNLARRVPRSRAADDAVAAARHALDDAKHRAEPYIRPADEAERDVCAAEADLRLRRGELERAARWRRRGARDLVEQASERLAAAQARVEDAERIAAPYRARVRAAETSVQQAHHEATVARIRNRLDNLWLRPPARAVERDHGVDLTGM